MNDSLARQVIGQHTQRHFTARTASAAAAATGAGRFILRAVFAGNALLQIGIVGDNAVIEFQSGLVLVWQTLL